MSSIPLGHLIKDKSRDFLKCLLSALCRVERFSSQRTMQFSGGGTGEIVGRYD